MGSEIKLTTRSLFGYVLVIIGLVMLGYVSMNAIYLANGTFKPLQVQINDQTGRALISAVETQVLFGIMIQGIMYGLLIAVASVLLKYGLAIARQP
jgi:hypothetical protein